MASDAIETLLTADQTGRLIRKQIIHSEAVGHRHDQGIIVNIRYYIDQGTGVPHIHNHDVDEAEVDEVLRNPGEDRPGREGSRVTIGQTQHGRYLRVI